MNPAATSSPASVADVPELNLCTSCGVCAGVCPARAITMRIAPGGTWAPGIDSSLCNECGLCRKACAGLGFDFPEMQQRLFGGEPEHPEIGHFLNLYAGHCTDPDLRWKAQSGGVASTLLIHLLERKVITGALVVRWNPSAPMEAEPFIARTRAEILQSTGSKYRPVPTGELIAALLREEGPFAVIGPSCLIQSIRKAEEAIPGLARKIDLRIGLFCLNVFTMGFHDYVLKRLSIKPGDVRSFAHRGKAWRGWPGNLRIETHDGRILDMPEQDSRHTPRTFFSAWRCNLCIDKTNEFADLSCGDCRVARHYGVERLSKLGRNHPGLSDIIVRTERGRQALESAVAAGLFHLETSNLREIAESVFPAAKKLGLEPFAAHARRRGWGVPAYGVRYLPATGEGKALAHAMQRRTRTALLFYVWTHRLRRHSWYPGLLAGMSPSWLRAVNQKVFENSWPERLKKCPVTTSKEDA